MFPFRSVFLAALVLTASCTREAEQPPPEYFDSLRLVSAMREDELMVLVVRSAKAARNEIDARDTVCLDRYDFPELTDIPARRITDTLTAPEVEDALKYFQSAGGRKFVRRAELELTGKLADAEALTAAEQAELEQFKQRPAGRKLLRDRITADTASMEQATTRFDLYAENCAYERQSASERIEPPMVCRSKAVASADHVCLANYTAQGSGASREARVEVDCRHHGKSLRSEIGMPPHSPVALRWSASRELQILIQDDNLRIVSSGGAQATQRFSVAIRKRGDPPVLECLPARGSIATSLPFGMAIASWRAHRQPGSCFMTARVPKEQMPGAEADVLLQFRRHQTAALPFATSRLVLIAQIQEMKERPAHVSLGSSPLALIDHGPPRHMLVGKDAEALLQSLASQPGQLTVQPEGASPYSVPISRQDFDFAYPDFSACLAGLKTT
jgi:hypothetical protein